MPQRSYTVNKARTHDGDDTSFRSCICALLLFIAVCGFVVIICYFIIPLTVSQRKRTSHDDEGHYERYGGDERMEVPTKRMSHTINPYDEKNKSPITGSTSSIQHKTTSMRHVPTERSKGPGASGSTESYKADPSPSSAVTSGAAVSRTDGGTKKQLPETETGVGRTSTDGMKSETYPVRTSRVTVSTGIRAEPTTGSKSNFGLGSTRIPDVHRSSAVPLHDATTTGLAVNPEIDLREGIEYYSSGTPKLSNSPTSGKTEGVRSGTESDYRDPGTRAETTARYRSPPRESTTDRTTYTPDLKIPKTDDITEEGLKDHSFSSPETETGRRLSTGPYARDQTTSSPKTTGRATRTGAEFISDGLVDYESPFEASGTAPESSAEISFRFGEGLNRLTNSTGHSPSTGLPAQIPWHSTNLTTEPTLMKASAPAGEEAPVPAGRFGCNSSEYRPQEEKLCDTTDCKFMASHMLSLMDYREDPCEDFFQYSCGSPINRNQKLGEVNSMDVDQRLLEMIESLDWMSSINYKNFKNFYSSCITYYVETSEEDRVNKAKLIIEHLGFYNLWRNLKNIDLTQLILKLIQTESFMIFDIDIDASSRNSSFYDIVLKTPSRSLLFSSYNHMMEHCEYIFKNIRKDSIDINFYYSEYVNCTQNYASYINSVEDAMTKLGFYDLSDLKAVWIIQSVQVAAQRILNALQVLPIKSNQTVALTKKDMKEITLGEMQRLYPQIEWVKLLKAMFNSRLIDQKTQVQVYFKEELEILFEEVLKGDLDVKQALIGMFVENVYREFVLEKRCDLKNYCLKISKYLIPDVASGMYLSTFEESELSSIVKQTNKIKDELIKTIKTEIAINAVSYSNISKENIYRKLDALTLPEPQALEEDLIKESFLDFPLEEDYVSDVFKMIKRKLHLRDVLYDRSPQNPRVLWYHQLLPFSPRDAFIYNVNAIMIPLTMSKVLIDSGPTELGINMMRQTIARGIAHSIDFTGILYHAGWKEQLLVDEDHFIISVFTTEVGVEVSYRETILTSRKNSYIYYLNPYLTLNARVADITAARLVLLYLRSSGQKLPYLWGGFSPEQAYFIHLTQTLCSDIPFEEYTVMMFEEPYLPPLLSVNNIVTNLQEFADAFHCPLGSNMNPEMKFVPFPWKGDS